jgi:hypothetical protein
MTFLKIIEYFTKAREKQPSNNQNLSGREISFQLTSALGKYPAVKQTYRPNKIDLCL